MAHFVVIDDIADLEFREGEIRDALYDSIYQLSTALAVEESDPNTLYQKAKNLKQCRNEFLEVSRKLSHRCVEHQPVGLTSSSVIKRRHEAVIESKQVINDVNRKLKMLDLDLVSNADLLTVAGSHTSVEREENADSQQEEMSPAAEISVKPKIQQNVPKISHLKPTASTFHPNFFQKSEKLPNYNPLPERNYYHDPPPSPRRSEKLDASALRRLKEDLLFRPRNLYGGEPCLFWPWKRRLEQDIEQAELSASDSIYVIQANTNNRPKQVVSNMIASAADDPNITLHLIWETLVSRFGSSSSITRELLTKLEDFPQIKSTRQIRDLEDFLDLCRIINSNIPSCKELLQMNIAVGMKRTWEKLPNFLQSRWQRKMYEHSRDAGVTPNFCYFVDFMQEAVKEFSLPGFQDYTKHQKPVKAFKTDIVHNIKADAAPSIGFCILHPSGRHSSENCNGIGKLNKNDLHQLILKEQVCFRCLGKHLIKDCKSSVKCSQCQGFHATAVHKRFEKFKRGESSSDETEQKENKLNLCSSLDNKNRGSICSKTLLVNLKHSKSDRILKCYCIIDEQSNGSFVDQKIIDYFKIKAPKINYNSTTLHGLKSNVSGYLVDDLKVKGVESEEWIELPSCYSCVCIPDTKYEVATREMVKSHSHISKYASNFLETVDSCDVLLLVGANCGPIMRTKCFGTHAPYVHKTPLGWSLVGPICREPDPLNKNTVTLRSTVDSQHAHMSFVTNFKDIETIPDNIDDEFLGESKNDKKFYNIMDNSITTNSSGHLQMKLPFKDDSVLPDNRQAVFKRSLNTLIRLKRDPKKISDCITVMAKYIKNGHVTQIDENNEKLDQGKFWYIPVFSVTHPKKGKVRLVFDSSASFNGVSLNGKLLQGPDNNNLLLGVLMRLRNGKIGFSCDIETMFHNFYVDPAHVSYLRFFWFSQNNPSNKICVFQANVHIFGNTCSPAVANFGLRYAATHSPAAAGSSSRDFLMKNMYVDDGLGSADTPTQAIQTLRGAIDILAHYNIKLHKVASNDPTVSSHFSSDLVNSKTINAADSKGETSTLGIVWNTQKDTLSLKGEFTERPYTKRGILSFNGLNFDPLGMTAPISLRGKLFQRTVLPPKSSQSSTWLDYDWDDPLPDEYKSEWLQWMDSLNDLHKIEIPRSYLSTHSETTSKTIHMFCDASKDSIAYVAYLRIKDKEDFNVSFLVGNSKVAPKMANTIPRLELNSAVEASLASRRISVELEIQIELFVFYTDSKVLMGYIHNQDKKFTRYVTRRIETILSYSTPEQWQYIRTDENPADVGTRPHTPEELLHTRWLKGPKFLWEPLGRLNHDGRSEPSELPEIVEEKTSLISKHEPPCSISSTICSRTNSWRKSVSIMRFIVQWLHVLDKVRQNRGGILAARNPVPGRNEVAKMLIGNAQNDSFHDTLVNLRGKENLSASNTLSKLTPFIDSDGIMRVGGRIDQSRAPFHVRHPIIMPKNHPLTKTLVHSIHHKCLHSGRHITHGIIRSEGYYILDGIAYVRNLIKNCVMCKILRGPQQQQLFSELPADRLEEIPPFSNVGMDVFGPYSIHDGKCTRSSKGTKKMWGLLFTCLCSRAVHIEPLFELDTSSFRNALSRFVAVRGVCKLIRSDRGTNFIGTRNELGGKLDFHQLKAFTDEQEITWELTTAGASSHGGVWERKIGSIKSALSCAMKQLHKRLLSRDELITLFQEVCSVVNNTPLCPLLKTPEDSMPLSPAMLLTMRESPTPPPLENFSETDLAQYGRRRWRRVQFLSNQFWSTWRTEYLTSLQDRHKWRSKNSCASPGDVVLLRDKSAKRNQWPLAVVVDTKKSRDGLVRSVSLKVGGDKPRYLERGLLDTIMLIPSKNHKCDL